MNRDRSAVLILGALTLGVVLTPTALRAGDNPRYDVSLVSLQVLDTKADGSP